MFSPPLPTLANDGLAKRVLVLRCFGLGPEGRERCRGLACTIRESGQACLAPNGASVNSQGASPWYAGAITLEYNAALNSLVSYSSFHGWERATLWAVQSWRIAPKTCGVVSCTAACLAIYTFKARIRIRRSA